MRQHINPCLEQHLPDKVKRGTSVEAGQWFDAAAAHVASALLVLDADPSGSVLLGWAAMHKTAKGIVAFGDCRLENETHGKMVGLPLLRVPRTRRLRQGPG